MQEVWRAREKLLECSPNFPSASITRYTYAKSMNQLFQITSLNEIYDEKAENPGEKREKNRRLNIYARECDAITVLNKIMDARSR